MSTRIFIVAMAAVNLVGTVEIISCDPAAPDPAAP